MWPWKLAARMDFLQTGHVFMSGGGTRTGGWDEDTAAAEDGGGRDDNDEAGGCVAARCGISTARNARLFRSDDKSNNHRTEVP